MRGFDVAGDLGTVGLQALERAQNNAHQMTGTCSSASGVHIYNTVAGFPPRIDHTQNHTLVFTHMVLSSSLDLFKYRSCMPPHPPKKQQTATNLAHAFHAKKHRLIIIIIKKKGIFLSLNLEQHSAAMPFGEHTPLLNYCTLGGEYSTRPKP